MDVNAPSLWLLLTPPLAGAIIGYFTNDLAIQMLFRPYRALFIGSWKLPFTPGLIPSNQGRLAQRISDAIMGSLLTPEEIQNLTRKLLVTERVHQAILWLLHMAVDQVRSQQQQKTALIFANILRDLLNQSLPRIFRIWARREDFLESQLNQIFDQVLLEFQFTEAQANRLVDLLFESVITTDVLREGIINFLTDRNIQTIDESFREKTSGTYWLVANLLGLKNTLIRLRNFCLDESSQMNDRLEELLIALEIRARLREWLQDFSLQDLPVTTVRQLRRSMREAVRSYLQARGPELLQDFTASLDWEQIAQTLLKRLSNSAVLNESLDLVSWELALVLERYLEQDLERIVEQVIPVLGIDQVIIERVKATPPSELEDAIQGIVKSELQAIVNLGGVLGFMVGLLQSVLLWIRT